MKKITVCVILGCIHLIAADDVVSKLEALKQFQPTPKVIRLDYNPFITEDAMVLLKSADAHLQEVKQNKLIVLAIINQKAFISGKWYSVGENIDEGKITNINPSFVEVKKGNKLSKITFASIKHLLHVKDNQK